MFTVTDTIESSDPLILPNVYSHEINVYEELF